MLSARTQEYIEEILSPHFGGMMSFVKEVEAVLERGQAESLHNYERQYLKVITVISLPKNYS